MPFLGDVVVTPILPEGTRWRLVESFRYEGRSEMFSVPAGFETDFASVPRIFAWFLPRYGRYTQAAVLHDYLWDLARDGIIDKYDADGILVRALRELRVPFLQRWIMWAGVRWASGPRSWFSRGVPPFLWMIFITLPTLAVVIVPAVTILLALLVGAVVEFLLYFPLRALQRDASKSVNRPRARDFFLS